MSPQREGGSGPTTTTTTAREGQPASGHATTRNLRFDESARSPHKPRTNRRRPVSPHPDFAKHGRRRFQSRHAMGPARDGQGVKQDKHAFLSKPSVALVIWNFLIAVPICYVVTLLIKFLIEKSGHELHKDVLFVRGTFVALNMLFILSWAAQLDRKYQEEKHNMEVAMWDARIELLEEMLAASQAHMIEDQLKVESECTGQTPDEPIGHTLDSVLGEET